jgi:histidine triad (HIT) family protein
LSISHAPAGWDCTFCRITAGGESQRTKRDAVVWHDEHTTAWVASHWWPANPGHVIVVPNVHAEHLYDLPEELFAPLMAATKRMALALKAAYGCDGISTRQHNEPAGNQDLWHWHQHVFPRWEGDRLYERHLEKAEADPAEIARYADLVRAAISL